MKRQQKADLVIKLAEEGKNTREIAKVAHVSPKDIGTIIRNYLGEDNPEYSCKGLSINSKAFKLFNEGKSKVDVAIALDIDADQVFYIYEDYLRLLSLDRLTTMYRELGNDGIDLLYYLYNQLKWEGLATKKDIHRIIEQAEKLREMDQTLIETAADIGRLNSTKFQLERDVEEITRRIGEYESHDSTLDYQRGWSENLVN